MKFDLKHKRGRWYLTKKDDSTRKEPVQPKGKRALLRAKHDPKE